MKDFFHFVVYTLIVILLGALIGAVACGLYLRRSPRRVAAISFPARDARAGSPRPGFTAGATVALPCALAREGVVPFSARAGVRVRITGSGEIKTPARGILAGSACRENF